MCGQHKYQIVAKTQANHIINVFVLKLTLLTTIINLQNWCFLLTKDKVILIYNTTKYTYNYQQNNGMVLHDTFKINKNV